MVDGALEKGEGLNGVIRSVLDDMPCIAFDMEDIARDSVVSKMAISSQPEAVTDVKTHGKKIDYCNGNIMSNGVHAPMNGIYTNGISTTPSEVQPRISNAIENLVGQLPPEIEHITFGYTPLSTLVSRLVQETFNGLTDVINDMSEMSPPHTSQNAPPNHFHAQVNGSGEPSQSNVQKKLRMLNFAGDRRAQFIKILILSKWARRADEVGKVIDLNVWGRQRLQEYQDCIAWMGELKRRLVPLKDPNPDIKTAIEVLSLGKATWVPGLEYIPPAVLTPKEMLSALRRINTLLSIRLNLHEDIPPVFRDYSIGSGRVTFRVPDEFELDLSIAEEDPSSQLYFIDFRLNFYPVSAGLPSGRLRDEVEGKANDILRREGLQDLFDFLHSLVLTHKLSILRNQAYAMARGYWSETLTVEAVHRSVVVQYWLKRPGGKNWIEIGLERGTESRPAHSSSPQVLPRIAVRWFRGGREVPDVKVGMDLGNLSLPDSLQQVIALHTSYVFEEIASRLRKSLLYAKGCLRLRYQPSTTEPTEVSLVIQLTPSKAVKIVQEPVSGKFVLLPASQMNSNAEFKLNQLIDPAIEGASQLAAFRSLVSQEEIETSVGSSGWEMVRILNTSQDNLQRVFGKEVQKPRYFTKQAWNPSWLLAFATSLEGDSLWIVNMHSTKTSQDIAIAKQNHKSACKAAYRILPQGTKPLVIDVSPSALAKVERIAAGMIARYMDSHYLASHRISYRIQTVARISTSRRTSLLINFPKKRASTLNRSPDLPDLSWAHETIKLEYRGLDNSSTLAVHVASTHLSHAIPDIKDLISKVPSIVFHTILDPETGIASEALSFHILTKIGESTIPNLISRLSAIGLLLDSVSAIKSNNAEIKTVSLSQIKFIYRSKPICLSATIQLHARAPVTLSLSNPNPHLRIIGPLVASLRSKGVAAVLSVMQSTQSLLDALARLESSHSEGGLEILTRSEEWYQVRYSAPYTKGGFDIQLRRRRDDLKWFIPENLIKKGDAANEEFEDGLKLLMKTKHAGWFGVNGGMIADLQGVEDMMMNIDEVWRKSKHTPSDSNSKKRKAVEEIVEID